jgi:hypothetical protein
MEENDYLGNLKRARKRLDMKSLGKRAILARNLAQRDEQYGADDAASGTAHGGADDAASGTAQGHAAFMIGAATAARMHSSWHPGKKKRKTRCCAKYAHQLLFGQDAEHVREHGRGAVHAQTKLERRATKSIEGIHRNGTSYHSDDHELAMQTRGVLDGLVIKREAVLDDLSLRM